MPRGGYRGGVKPTLPEELKRKPAQFFLSPQEIKLLEQVPMPKSRAVGLALLIASDTITDSDLVALIKQLPPEEQAHLGAVVRATLKNLLQNFT